MERSASGGQLEALERASAHQAPCPKCLSARRRIFCEQEGRVFDDLKERGLLHLLNADRLRRGVLAPGYLPSGAVCPRCHGSGSVEAPIGKATGEITARPIGREVHDHGYEVDLGKMAKHARVTRCLRKVDGIRSLYYQALVAYYGPDATACALVKPWSLTLAVMPLTEAGAKLLDRYPPKRGEGARPAARMASIGKAETDSPSKERRDALEAAYSEAEALREQALGVFARFWRESDGE